MVKNRSHRLDDTFSALSDPTRRAILSRLAIRETRVTDLARPFGMSLPAISKHLRVLEQSGLIRKKKVGRVQKCKINARPMKEAAIWISFYSRFWTHQFKALQKFLQHKVES